MFSSVKQLKKSLVTNLVQALGMKLEKSFYLIDSRIKLKPGRDTQLSGIFSNH